MTRSHMKNTGTAMLLTLALASCSHSPTAPSATPEKAAATGVDAGLTQSAAGDVKSGPVDLDINLVRVAQTDGVAAFYAHPGGEYTVRLGHDVEIYVQIWTSNPAVQNPRLIVDWGNGVRENIGCGSCRLSRAYLTEGKFKVTVTLDDRVSSFTTRTFTLNVTRSFGAGTFTFSNGTVINIPAGQPGSTSGIASPYPSGIGVSGVAGTIGAVTVTINGYSHTFHADVTVLLVAPNGRTVSLMNNSGGSSDAVNATITFQDGAAAFPNSLLAGSFTFAPGGGSGSVLPGPAPGAPYGAAFSTLNGIDPNGTWQLFVNDDAGSDSGQFAGGWSLTITTVP